MKILFISHDYTKTGAPTALLRLIKSLKKLSDIELYIDFIYERGDEKQLQSFLKITERVKVVKPAKLFTFKKVEFDLIFSNTIVTGEVIEELTRLRKPIFTWIHEMPRAIEQYGMFLAKKIAQNSVEIWAVNQNIIDFFNQHFLVRQLKVFRGIIDYSDTEIMNNENQQHPLSIATVINNSWKKGGYDIPKVVQILPNNHYKITIYGIDKNQLLAKDILYQTTLMGYNEIIKMKGFVDNLSCELSHQSVFLSLSHEDAFPLVCLEAASVGLPIICWDKGTGIVDFVQNDAGWVVEYQNFDALKAVFEEIIANPEILKQKGEVARQRVLAEYTSEVRAKQFLELIGYTQ